MAGPPLLQHAEESADASPRWCAEEPCRRRPFFGPPGGKPMFCAQHSKKSEGMVDVSSRRCEAVGCAKWPLYGNEGQKAKFCSLHKWPSMIDVRSRRCAASGCKRQPSYGYEGKRACFCAAHKAQGMVDVVSRRCEKSNCRRRPLYGYEGQKSQFCSAHKQEGQVDVCNRRCKQAGCSKRPCFGLPGQRPCFCGTHRSAEMVDVISHKCGYPGCSHPTGHEANRVRSKFCDKHKSVGLAGASLLQLAGANVPDSSAPARTGRSPRSHEAADVKPPKGCEYGDPWNSDPGSILPLGNRRDLEEPLPGQMPPGVVACAGGAGNGAGPPPPRRRASYTAPQSSSLLVPEAPYLPDARREAPKRRATISDASVLPSLHSLLYDVPRSHLKRPRDGEYLATSAVASAAYMEVDASPASRPPPAVPRQRSGLARSVFGAGRFGGGPRSGNGGGGGGGGGGSGGGSGGGGGENDSAGSETNGTGGPGAPSAAAAASGQPRPSTRTKMLFSGAARGSQGAWGTGGHAWNQNKNQSQNQSQTQNQNQNQTQNQNQNQNRNQFQDQSQDQSQSKSQSANQIQSQSQSQSQSQDPDGVGYLVSSPAPDWRRSGLSSLGRAASYDEAREAAGRNGLEAADPAKPRRASAFVNHASTLPPVLTEMGRRDSAVEQRHAAAPAAGRHVPHYSDLLSAKTPSRSVTAFARGNSWSLPFAFGRPPIDTKAGSQEEEGTGSGSGSGAGGEGRGESGRQTAPSGGSSSSSTTLWKRSPPDEWRSSDEGAAQGAASTPDGRPAGRAARMFHVMPATAAYGTDLAAPRPRDENPSATASLSEKFGWNGPLRAAEEARGRGGWKGKQEAPRRREGSSSSPSARNSEGKPASTTDEPAVAALQEGKESGRRWSVMEQSSSSATAPSPPLEQEGASSSMFVAAWGATPEEEDGNGDAAREQADMADDSTTGNRPSTAMHEGDGGGSGGGGGGRGEHAPFGRTPSRRGQMIWQAPPGGAGSNGQGAAPPRRRWSALEQSSTMLDRQRGNPGSSYVPSWDAATTSEEEPLEAPAPCQGASTACGSTSIWGARHSAAFGGGGRGDEREGNREGYLGGRPPRSMMSSASPPEARGLEDHAAPPQRRWSFQGHAPSPPLACDQRGPPPSSYVRAWGAPSEEGAPEEPPFARGESSPCAAFGSENSKARRGSVACSPAGCREGAPSDQSEGAAMRPPMSRRGSVAAAPVAGLTAEEYAEPTAAAAAAARGRQRRRGSVMEPGSGAFSSSPLSSLPPPPPPVGDEEGEEEPAHQRDSAMGGEQQYPVSSREEVERRRRRSSTVLPPAGECSAETERGMSPAEDQRYSQQQQQQRLPGCRFGRSAVVTPPSIRRSAVGERGAADHPGATGRC